MTKEQQDLAWACLPKEAREEIKNDFNSNPTAYHPYFNEGYGEALKIYFGSHNLTSDTEPEELLLTPIKRAQQLYEECKNLRTPTTEAVEKAAYGGMLLVLQELFGDKCLPDKEPSVQVEPKFKVGDKVIVIDNIRAIYTDPMTIKGVLLAEDGKYCYNVIEYGIKFHEDNLEPYTEPELKFKIGDKVKVIDIEEYAGEVTEIISVDESDSIAPYKLDLLDNEGCGIWCDENAIEPHTEPETKNESLKEQQEFQERILCNPDRPTDEEIYRDLTGEIPMEIEEKEEVMEEKKLNLVELLKGCEGTILYSRAYGDVSLNEIVHDDRPNAQEIKLYTPDPQSDRIWFLRNGLKHKNGEIDLWPSKELYEKYPLDAYSAWMEWKEARKSKTPKTWNDIKANLNKYIFNSYNEPEEQHKDYCIDITGYNFNGYTRRNTFIENSALALLKIHQLIEVGYGGTVTEEDFNNLSRDESIYYIVYNHDIKRFMSYACTKTQRSIIIFHTKEQAEEFLSYPENIQLLKDYYMV